MSGFYAFGDHFAIDLPGARAVFTTRRGGFSSGPYESLNLGRLTSDDPESVDRNRRILTEYSADMKRLLKRSIRARGGSSATK